MHERYKLDRRITSALLLAWTASTATAQDPVDATLYTRVEGDTVRAAIELEIEPGWHLYHTELGHPKAVGRPTKVTLTGEGVSWSGVRFPEPHEFDQSEFGEGVYILGHEDTIVLYAIGRLEEGAEGKDVKADINALVCELSCIPYTAKLSSKGEGTKVVWEEFPADLRPPSPVPTSDFKEGGEADATLYARAVEGRIQAAVVIDITPGWHLYHTEKGNPLGIGKPTKLFLEGEGIAWGEPVWPEPERQDQSDIIEGAWIHAHEGRIVVYAEGEAAKGVGPEAVWARIEGQTCEDVCLEYVETVARRGEGDDALWSGWPGARPEEGEGRDEGRSEPEEGAAVSPAPDEGAEAAGAGTVSASVESPPATADALAGAARAKDATPDKSLGAFLLEAVFWALVTLLMPCTYPMIPITISVLHEAGRGASPQRAAARADVRRRDHPHLHRHRRGRGAGDRALRAAPGDEPGHRRPVLPLRAGVVRSDHAAAAALPHGRGGEGVHEGRLPGRVPHGCDARRHLVHVYRPLRRHPPGARRRGGGASGASCSGWACSGS